MKKELKSFLIALFAFIIIGFLLRCFPLGCELFNFSELIKIFFYVFLSIFILSYTFFYLKEQKSIEWKKLFFSFFIIFFTAFIGSLFTSENTDSSWYNSIKSEITPPNWIFPIVWNILFFFIAFSLYFSWIKLKNSKIKNRLFLLFGINLFLNALWSLLFFKLQNPLIAFFELIFLVLSTLSLMIFIKKIDKKSYYLLIPYLIWLIFARILNFLINFN